VSAPINDGGPAFPHAQRLWDSDAQSWAVHSIGGMTLRDYFAAAALCAVYRRAYEADVSNYSTTHPETIARRAYEYADGMLAIRKKDSER
jgi:hypothetical protein